MWFGSFNVKITDDVDAELCENTQGDAGRCRGLRHSVHGDLGDNQMKGFPVSFIFTHILKGSISSKAAFIVRHTPPPHPPIYIFLKLVMAHAYFWLLNFKFVQFFFLLCKNHIHSNKLLYVLYVGICECYLDDKCTSELPASWFHYTVKKKNCIGNINVTALPTSIINICTDSAIS